VKLSSVGEKEGGKRKQGAPTSKLFCIDRRGGPPLHHPTVTLAKAGRRKKVAKKLLAFFFERNDFILFSVSFSSKLNLVVDSQRSAHALTRSWVVHTPQLSTSHARSGFSHLRGISWIGSKVEISRQVHKSQVETRESSKPDPEIDDGTG